MPDQFIKYYLSLKIKNVIKRRIPAWLLITVILVSAHSVNKTTAGDSSFVLTDTDSTQQNCIKKEGFRDIIRYGENLIAFGTGGRIDRISYAGEHVTLSNPFTNVTLNEAVTKGKSVIVAGDKGTILYSADGESYRRLVTGTGADLNTITLFGNYFIAGADSGIVFLSRDGTSWGRLELQLKGNIVSLSADDTRCAGVTDEGEMIMSNDGLNWEIFDYNNTYKGFAKPCRFRKVLTAGKRIVVAGVHDDNTPAVLFSTMGKVWTDRLLNYTDISGLNGYLENLPNDLAYDPVEDQYLVACDNGEVLSLPPCTKCNSLIRISSADLYAVVCSDNFTAVAGSDFFYAKAGLR